ncbi:hypothetical protein BDK51DRAFT_45670 [Blyttiomyces helicus]|uniref:Uncharacterized protein n=1 Tax=Blyttiomyces helicus TaxID=388810 RepID=A0A4P9WHL7_9FUNG|nr:hypothetical protein BDK51DRAFT_45670 [Blyttiomyces helicus]|eukprot:RKO91445.1 hypothetical protein BDK51DRAFT_45670 [Blyttiomyces helicus]
MQLFLKNRPASWRPFPDEILATCARNFKIRQPDCSADVRAGDPIRVLGTATDNSAFYVLRSASSQRSCLPAHAVYFGADPHLPAVAAVFIQAAASLSTSLDTVSNADGVTLLSPQMHLPLAASTGLDLLDEVSFETAAFGDHPLMSQPSASSTAEPIHWMNPEKDVNSMSSNRTPLLFASYDSTGSPNCLLDSSLFVNQDFLRGAEVAPANPASTVPFSEIAMSPALPSGADSDVACASPPINASPASIVRLSPSVGSPGSPSNTESDLDSVTTRHGINILQFQKDRFPRKSKTGAKVTHVGTLEKLLDPLEWKLSGPGGNIASTPAACEVAQSVVAGAAKVIWRVWLPQAVWIKFRTLKAACAPADMTHPEFVQMLLEFGGLEAVGTWSQVNEGLLQKGPPNRAYDWTTSPSASPVPSPPSVPQTPPMGQFD